MTTSATDSPFTDADQLNADLADAKRGDTQRVSQPADAVAIVETFKANTAAGAWPTLDRATVADRLTLILTDPDSNAPGGSQVDVPDANGHSADTCGARIIQQGGLNLCGPAALMTRWAYRDPVAFANFATQLFDSGTAQLGSLAITPSDDLRNADYSEMLAKMSANPSPQADWMFLGALRNTTNVFWQPSWDGDPNQNVAGMTLPSQLTDWFNATGVYAKVDNQANLMEEKGVAHLTSLDNLPGQDIVLLINANLLAAAEKNSPDASWILNQFPNHFVVLLNSPTASADGSTISFTAWTWGRTSLVGSTPDGSGGTLTVPTDTFMKNYYGAVIATMPPPSSP